MDICKPAQDNGRTARRPYFKRTDRIWTHSPVSYRTQPRRSNGRTIDLSLDDQTVGQREDGNSFGKRRNVEKNGAGTAEELVMRDDAGLRCSWCMLMIYPWWMDGTWRNVERWNRSAITKCVFVIQWLVCKNYCETVTFCCWVYFK